jgi:hypothetical protein
MPALGGAITGMSAMPLRMQPALIPFCTSTVALASATGRTKNVAGATGRLTGRDAADSLSG